MAQLEAAVHALHIENSTNLVAFQLGVRVVVNCTAELNAIEYTARKIECTLPINTPLF